MAQVIRSGQTAKPAAEKKPAKPKPEKKAKPAKAAKPVKAKSDKPKIKKPRKMSTLLNPKELKVAQKLLAAKGKDVRLEELAEAFEKKGTGSRSKGNSWARNSLRKLRALKLAKQTGRGTYQALVSKLPPECLDSAGNPKLEARKEKSKAAKPAAKKEAKPKKAKAAKPKEEAKSASEKSDASAPVSSSDSGMEVAGPNGVSEEKASEAQAE